MADYLAPVGGGVRKLAAIACVLAALVAGTLAGLVVFWMIKEGRITSEGKPLWMGAVVCGLIAMACGWMGLRLWSGRTRNGVTVLPVWFIETFAALFLGGMVWLCIEESGDLELAAAIGLAAAAVLFTRRGVRRRASAAGVQTGSPGPLFHLIVVNDETHSYGYVVGLLQREFGLPFEAALALTRAIDETGLAVVFTGSLDEVEIARDRMLAAGPDPALPTSTGPLQVRVETADWEHDARAES